MKRFTKIAGFILAMVMLVSIMVVPVSAEEHHGNMGDLQWEFNSETKTLTISGEGEMQNFTSSASRPWEIPNVLKREDIEHVVIEDGVTSIGANAFENHINMEDVSIPDSVQNINVAAFHFCKSLTDVHLPEGLPWISANTFNGCSNLETINIPSTVREIKDGAFQKCYNLTITNLPEGLTKIGEYAFGSIAATEMYIPKNVVYIAESAFNHCLNMTAVEVDPNNEVYASYNGALYKKNMEELLYYPAGMPNTEYEVPSSVKRIGKLAFNSNSNLKTVILNEGLQTIGDDAFKSCTNLETINFPSTLSSIGVGAFYNCGFKELVFPETLDRVGGGVALECSKLTDVTFLNPYCTIDGTYAFAKNVVIHGYLNSTAQRYANELMHQNPFVLLNPFFDVVEGKWYYHPVLWAYSNSITSGTSFHSFSPDQSCTRSQVVTFLWRAAGSPIPNTTENPFVDVKSSAYYYNAVLWAYENGITTGVSHNEFGVDQVCSRAQIVTFLWRAANSPCVCPDTENPFVDVPNSYYKVAVLWAAKNGITAGVDSTHFGPDYDCSRSQIVTFLYKAVKTGALNGSVTNEPKQSLTIVAHDTSDTNNVANIEFRVYDEEEKLVYNGTTNKNGELKVPAEYLNGGETYIVKELVPEGLFCQSENAKTVVLNKENKVVDFYNARQNGVLVVVEDNDGNAVNNAWIHLDYIGVDYQIDDHCEMVSEPGGACIINYFDNNTYDLNRFFELSCVDQPIRDGYDIQFTFEAREIPENTQVSQVDFVLKRADGTAINQWTTTDSNCVELTNDNTFVVSSAPFYGAYAYQEDANLLIRITIGN